MLKKTCLVNNYNYREYVVDAINSAIFQTVSFDEVIVVDDLSTDDSVDVIKAHYQDNPSVKIICKNQNEGQLSAFNRGFLEASGDIICFLDADDKYKPEYLESILRIYEQRPECECLFTAIEKFTDNSSSSSEVTLKISTEELLEKVETLSHSVISTYYLKAYSGIETSGISFRRQALSKILPIPYIEDWRIRADDCLVYGASLAKLGRCKLHHKLIDYRIHSHNHYFNQKETDLKKQHLKSYEREIAINRFFNLMIKRMNYDTNSFPEMAIFEFKTISRPSYKYFWFYFNIVLNSRLGISRKIIYLLSMAKYMKNSFKKSL
jgi:glycosyltransferase involved in cell wall biosynthesis